ncbi:MAG: hypothetical protein M3N22_01225 [Acidobacteriota bacterium]|nr:hypothetical protein [Acidobacteriota bacterium]
MRKTSNSGNYFARSVALCVACFLVMFLVQAVIHGHEKGQDESACRVCHVSHIAAGPSVNSLLLSAPLLTNGRAHEADITFHKELFTSGSPSRAPPTA